MLEEEIPLHQEKSLNHYVAAMQKRRCGRWHVRKTRSYCGHREGMQTFRNEAVGVGSVIPGWGEEHQDVVIRHVAADL